MTPEQASKLHIEGDLYDALIATFEKFDICTPDRKAAFIGQCKHESANFKRTHENLNYRASALKALFSRSRISEEDCEKYGRTDDHPADQAMIANTIYGGAWGLKNLGNEDEGDGWAYKGRGYIQLTGKANYRKAGEALGVDFLSNPELVETPMYAALTAGWFWDSKSLNMLADEHDWIALTKKINGGTIGLADRVAHIEEALQVLAS